MNAIRQKIQEIESLLKKGREGCLDFYELAKYEFDKSYLIDGGVILQKIEQTPSVLRFIATIPPSGFFKAHCHNCLEICTVLAGEIIDQKGKAGKGTTFIYERGETHSPKNITSGNAVLLIDFYK